jgi:hypothetical protein
MLMQIAAIIFTVLGTLAIIAIFVRSRAREGIRPFEFTATDKAQFQDLRRAVGRRVVGRLLGSLGGLFLIAGITSPLYWGASGRAGWSTAALLTGSGLLLVLCAVPLTKQSR